MWHSGGRSVVTVTTMRPFVAVNRTRRKRSRAGGQGTMMMTPSAAGFSHNIEEALWVICVRENWILLCWGASMKQKRFLFQQNVFHYVFIWELSRRDPSFILIEDCNSSQFKNLWYMCSRYPQYRKYKICGFFFSNVLCFKTDKKIDAQFIELWEVI